MIPLPLYKPSCAIQGTEEKWSSLTRLKNKEKYFLCLFFLFQFYLPKQMFWNFSVLFGFF